MSEFASDDTIHSIASATRNLSDSLLNDFRSNPKFIAPELERIIKIATVSDDRMSPIQSALQKASEDWSKKTQASDASPQNPHAAREADLRAVDLGKELIAVTNDLRKLYAEHITYEGIDMSDQDERIRAGYGTVGEQVRADPDRAIRGIDVLALAETLGSEPLTISATIVHGFKRENGLGDENTVMTVSHEFDGIPGRFPAQMFVPQEGLENAYGVILTQGDRMWLAPLDGHSNEPISAGNAREIVGFGGRMADQIHPEGFEAMKAEAAQEPMSGEFNFTNQNYGDLSGPITLVSAPWTSGVANDELVVAKEAINDAILIEGDNRRHSLEKEMAAASQAWRAEQNLTPGPDGIITSSRDVAETAAWGEAHHLLAGREDNAEARMVAAQIATANREITGGGDLNASALADALSVKPSPEMKAPDRKGILAQAASAPAPVSPAQAKGNNKQAVAAMAAALSKGGFGR